MLYKSQKVKCLYVILSFIFIILIYSCSKDGTSTFVVPATYRFNSPNLDSKYVYVIDYAAKKTKVISDSLGSFNRSNTEISDSLNALIYKEFILNSLRSVTFNTDNTAVLEFGRLDTTGVRDTILKTKTTNTKYSITGNQIKFEAHPEYYAILTNSFQELHFCQEFTLRSQKTAGGISVKKYQKNNCTNAEPNAVINNIITLSPTIVYDTISLEYVNYIFSTY